MSGAKYYVWASGAWREVQTSGRVAGWQRRARFLFVRRGRLQLAPRGVLRALAAHAAGRPSAVRDAARLSQRSFVHGYKSTKVPAVAPHLCCDKTYRCNGGPVVARGAADTSGASTKRAAGGRADASTQASPAQHTHTVKLNIHTQKKDPDEDFQRKLTIEPGPGTPSQRRARRGGKKHTPTKRSLSSSSSDSPAHFVTKKITTIATLHQNNVRSPNKIKKVVDSNSSEDSEGPTKMKPTDKLQFPFPPKASAGEAVERPNTSREGPKGFFHRLKLLQSRAGKTRRELTEDVPAPKRPKLDNSTSKPTPAMITKIIENLSDTTDCEPPQRETKTKKVDSSSDSDNPMRPPVARPPPTAQDAAGRRAARDHFFLELIVPEQDVLALRHFIERTDCADLERFDADDDYKNALFYSINPVVDIARCRRLERLQRLQGQERAPPEPDLERFAAGLGLRSVSDLSTRPSTYRMRRRPRNTSNRLPSSDSREDDEMEKDSTKRPSIDTSKRVINKSNVRKPVRPGDHSQGTGRELRGSTLRSKKMSNNKDMQNEDTSKEFNRNINKQLPNKHTINKADDTRNNTKHSTSKLAGNVSVNKITEHDGDSSEDFVTQVTKLRSSRRLTGNTTNKPKTAGAQSPGDSSEATNNKASTSKTKISTSKVTANRSDKTQAGPKDISKDRSSRSHARTSRSTPNVLRATISDGPDDVNIPPNKTKTKNSSKKPIVPQTQEIIIDSSDQSTNKLTEDRTTTSRAKRMTKKPNVPTRDSSEDTEEDLSIDKSRDNDNLPVGKGKKGSDKENVSRRANALGGGGDCELEDDLASSREAARRAARISHTISNRPSIWVAKEYSNLEDHAIVSWVQCGARASRVNGNAVWRELQDQYRRITGRERSWHSLRNRYLRYILPALAALRLPPADAARLRAAAATGALKGRRPQRRNSIFDKEPAVRGAACRRPPQHQPHHHSPSPSPEPAAPAPRRSLRSSAAPPASPPPSHSSPSPPPPRAPADSPRYSDVTRQFASRKLRSTPRSSPLPPPPPPPPPATGKSRKLFNPRAQL